ncbi:hypothetical protein BH20ACT24_BH20ACT24_13310 [soil metagenome]
MKARTASRLAWSLLGLAVAMIALTVLLEALNHRAGSGEGYRVGLVVVTFTAVGALIASQRPQNAIGWIYCAAGLLQALNIFGDAYARYGAVTRPGSLPGAEAMAWLKEWSWIPSLALVVTFLILLFPDGRLPSPRWRWVAWPTAGAIALLVAAAALILWPERRAIAAGTAVNDEVASPLMAVLILGFLLLLLGAIASVASIVVRFRRSAGEEHQQLKWFTSAGALIVVTTAIQFVPGIPEPVGYLLFVGLLTLPLATAVAILKHRLYDIDIVLNKTVVYGSLAAFITAVYVAIVVGVGELFGRGDEPNLALSIAATAVIAVAFQPVRERVQRLANRLVYGHRGSPYEVLSSLAGHMGEGYSTEDILPRMARILAEGTGARRAAVWMHIGEELRLQAAWPTDQRDEPLAVPSANGGLPPFPAVDRAVPIRHEGELLGALTVTKPRGESLTPAEDALISNLGSHAGLVLRNVRLTEDLLRSAREVRASRKRIVSAQNEERRRLERDIHDGAQQQLVALAVKMGLARQLLSRDPGRAGEVLEETARNSVEALETLRDLARGIYPPLLADQGLGAALAAQARKASLPVKVEAEGVERYDQGTEAAVYFCCLEALQNVTKYASATHARIRLAGERGWVSFAVEDDGRGFDPGTTAPGSGLTNMRDRLAALGGTLEIVSHSGEGTTVTGRVPLASTEPP